MSDQKEPVDVLIVGAGPAGLTAAIYSGRALLSTVMLDKGLPGGQLNETDLIENWPGFVDAVSAPELMKQMRAQAERFGASIVLDDVLRIEPGPSTHQVVTSQGSYRARTIILSPGSRPRELPVENASRLKGKGVSYCATCDGFFFQGKHIIQIGAGDSGLTESLFLTRFADSVTIVVRHPEDDPKAFRASAILQQRAREHPKVRFLWNRVVDSVEGDDHVTGVRLRHLVTGEVKTIPIDGVFVNIGHLPQTGFLGGTIDLDKDGYICTGAFLHTNVPGIFAAGDARVNANQYAQAVVAAGEGAIAAIEAEKYLAK
ncbi:thioredoxin-disulfide reductase [Candidatus Bipolaricaulota bacterium]